MQRRHPMPIPKSPKRTSRTRKTSKRTSRKHWNRRSTKRNPSPFIFRGSPSEDREANDLKERHARLQELGGQSYVFPQPSIQAAARIERLADGERMREERRERDEYVGSSKNKHRIHRRRLDDTDLTRKIDTMTNSYTTTRLTDELPEPRASSSRRPTPLTDAELTALVANPGLLEDTLDEEAISDVIADLNYEAGE